MRAKQVHAAAADERLSNAVALHSSLNLGYIGPAVRARGSSFLLKVANAVIAATGCATHLVHVLRTNRCSDTRYQGLTYLGADNGILAPEALPGSSKPFGSTTAFDFLASAAEAACTLPPPDPVTQTLNNEGPHSGVHDDASPPSEDMATAGGGVRVGGGGGGGVVPAGGCGVVVRVLEELDERAAGEACTPAGAAQALARVACRLYDLADDLGGG